MKDYLPDHDAASRKDDALVRPQSLVLKAAVFVLEVLHHDNAVEAWDVVLWRKRICEASREELLVVEANPLEVGTRRRRLVAGLGMSRVLESRKPMAVEIAFEEAGPLDFLLLRTVKLDGLLKNLVSEKEIDCFDIKEIPDDGTAATYLQGARAHVDIAVEEDALLAAFVGIALAWIAESNTKLLNLVDVKICFKS